MMPPDPADLRRRAEEALKTCETDRSGPLSSETALALVHELQVHQIELELQNEELVQTRHEAEALRDQYIDLYDFAPVGYFTIDRHGTILALNLTGSVLLSESRQALVGARLQFFMHPDFLRAFTAFCDRVLQSGTTETFEAEVSGARGGPRWYALLKGRADPAFPADRIRLVLSDITERKEAEEALRESEKRLRLAQERGDVRMWDWDVAADRVTVPPDFLGHHGIAWEAIRTFSDWERMIHPDDRKRVAAEHVATLATGEPFDLEFRLVVPSGEVRWVQLGGGGLTDERGGPVQVLGVLIDVTARKQAEDDLRKSEERYRSLVENNIDAVLLTSLDGAILVANAEACRIFGMTQEELIRGGWDAIIDRSDPRLAAAQEERDRTGRFRGELTYRRKDGSVFPGEVATALFTDPRGTRWVTRIIRDITDRKKAEEALQDYAERLRASNEELQRFAYVASHDLQEPLRSIVSFSQLLDRRYRGRLDKDADEYLSFIVEGGMRMQALIRDLLQVSRVETGARPLEPTDAAGVVAGALRALEAPLREADGMVTVGPMPRVMADAAQLEQVFTNLIGNAIKYRRGGVPPAITVSAERQGEMWEFAVRDNGIGIEAEYFDRIFVMFQRLHTHDEYEGTGIGLAVVKKIVDRHGGKVWVESTPGEGATFFFTLPGGVDGGLGEKEMSTCNCSGCAQRGMTKG